MIESMVTYIDTAVSIVMFEMALNQIIALGLIILAFLVFSVDISNRYTKKTNGVVVKELLKVNKWPNRILKSIWLIALYLSMTQLWYVFVFILVTIVIVFKNLKYLESFKPIITQAEIDKI